MQNRTINDLDNSVFLSDILLTAIVFCISFWARSIFLPFADQLNFYSHVLILPLIIFFIVCSLKYFGGYENVGQTKLVGYFWSVLKATAVTISVLLVLLFFLKVEYVSRLVILLFAVLEFAVLLIIRLAAVLYFREQVKSGKNTLRVLIVGSRSRAQDLYKALQEQMVLGVKVVGFIDPDPWRVGIDVFGIPVIGTVDNIHECLKNNVVDEVIIAISRSLLQDAEPIVMACEEEGIRVRFMADVFNVKVARVSFTNVNGIPLLNMEPVAQDSQQLLAKRIFDVACTLFVLPFLIPVFCIVALAIKLDSPGPVFFIQQRVGLRKYVFPMFKFRSMYVDAEERFEEVEHLNEATGPIFKIKDDPRITRVGYFLRKTSIDEIPQLLNVLRGEMSLVGPRPMSLRDVDLFDRGIQRKRFSVKPGLTCIWQISGRSELSFEKWLELDLEYIDRWSFWLDIGILFRTIPAVLKARGAA